MKKFLNTYIQRTKENKTWLSIPLGLLYYLFLFFQKQKTSKDQTENIAAIVLSWKRTTNLPFVVRGLKKQSCIRDIHIFHNHPSKLWVPGCKNIFSKTNQGCIARHEYARTLKEYDYFIFSDDDMALQHDHGTDIFSSVRKHGEKSILGFFGQKLNYKKPRELYTTGTPTSSDQIEEVDVVKGRFHVISKSGIATLADSGLDSVILRSEDDLRANIALQKAYNRPSYLIPLRKVMELRDNNARENRDIHFEYRDTAIDEGFKNGWTPFSFPK